MVEKEGEGQTPLTLPLCLLAFPCFAFALHTPKKVISPVIKSFHSQCQQLGLIQRGLMNCLPLKRGGLLEGGGLFERV